MRALLTVTVFAVFWNSACSAETSNSGPAATSTWITLGTAGGPEGEAERSQPANALLVGDDLYLVDAGDGAAEQLIRAGYRLPPVQGLFLSHLHFDHTAGVLAVLGLRMQLNARTTLTIYGPPGTITFVNGLLAGMEPARKAAYGMPGQEWSANVEVVELDDDAIVEMDGLVVTAAANSHFRIPEQSGETEKGISLSYRFDMEDRSITYTGDTGPSDNVAELAAGSDLLVSEMMDIPAVLERIRQRAPNLPEQTFAAMEWHFRAHHLTPLQVGELAAEAGVNTVVVTHMAPGVKTAEQADAYIEEIGSVFDGRIELAVDLDEY